MSSDIFDIQAGLHDAIAHAKGEGAGHRASSVTPVDVAELRGRLGLSQPEFALAFGVSVATIRNWEQGRRAPRGPARALLLVIEHEPEAVLRALNAA